MLSPLVLIMFSELLLLPAGIVFTQGPGIVEPVRQPNTCRDRPRQENCHHRFPKAEVRTVSLARIFLTGKTAFECAFVVQSRGFI